MKGRSFLLLMISLATWGFAYLPVLAQSPLANTKQSVRPESPQQITSERSSFSGPQTGVTREKSYTARNEMRVFYESPFTANGQSYVLLALQSMDGAVQLYISLPNSNQARPLREIAPQFMRKIEKSSNDNAAFVITVVEGNGWNVPVTSYWLDLSNPNSPLLTRLTILQQRGILEDGDSVMASDGSLYDTYNFEGHAGQSVTITLDSVRSFENYLLLMTPDGKKIAENYSNDQTSEVTVTLPSTGRYVVIVNGHNHSSRGPYMLSINSNQLLNRQQTATAPTRPTRQTFRNVQELGMAQFLQGNQELIDAYEALQDAAQGQYNVVEIPSNDFMDNSFTQIARERGTFFGGREDISYADYLKLKLKLNAQIEAYNNSLLILQKMQDYNNLLSNENRQGGREVSQRIVANFNSFWSKIEQQNRSPSLSLGRIISVLVYALEETRVSTQSFVLKAVQTGGKLAAAFNNFGRLSQLLNLPGSSNANATQFTGRSLDYATTLNEKLNDFQREFNAGNYEKLTDINLEIANATIGFLDPQNNPRMVRVGQAIAIRSEATKLRDLMILLQQPNGRHLLDDYDRFYLTVAGISSALKIGAETVTLLNPNPQQSPSQIAAKIKAINDLLFEGLQIGYKEEFRRKYEQLVFHDKQLTDRILGLSSSINYAAQQVGEYLLESRADTVIRQADGTIAVSIDGILYPPNSP